MTPFSRSLLDQSVTFLPLQAAESVQGGDLSAPAESGVTLAASVQARKVQRVQPDGQLLALTVYEVYLDDPTGLNGGLGVRADDGFRWRGLLLQAQGRATPQGFDNALWMAECLLIE